MLMLRSSTFNDLFGNEATQVSNGTTFGQVNGSSFGYHILNCVFSDMYSNRGSYDLVVVNGVIYFRTTHSVDLFVEDCVFCECSAGGIYFNCGNNGASMLMRICAYNCHTSLSDFKSGQFAYVITKNIKRNDIDLVSISHCGREVSSDKSHPIYLLYGNQKVSYLNSSNNKVYWYSGFSSDAALTFNMTYSSFYDNFASHSVCIYYHIAQRNNDQKFSFCNFVRNISPVSPGVFVINNDYNEHEFDFLYLIDCIFQDNQNDLFYNSNRCEGCERVIYLLRCWIQHSGNWQNRCNNGNIFERISCRFENYQTQTHAISFFNEDKCDPDYIHHHEINSPCQTLITHPPSPTNCEFNETVGMKILSSILSSMIRSFMMLHVLLIK